MNTALLLAALAFAFASPEAHTHDPNHDPIGDAARIGAVIGGVVGVTALVGYFAYEIGKESPSFDVNLQSSCDDVAILALIVAAVYVVPLYATYAFIAGGFVGGAIGAGIGALTSSE